MPHSVPNTEYLILMGIAIQTLSLSISLFHLE
jgi:hypothetical protein